MGLIELECDDLETMTDVTKDVNVSFVSYKAQESFIVPLNPGKLKKNGMLLTDVDDIETESYIIHVRYNDPSNHDVLVDSD